MFADEGDIVIAISSSGNSENIINASKMAKEKGCFLVTMSGFENDNKLIKLGDINFYLDNCSYGIVEIGHSMISHFIIDKYIAEIK
jgi:D-sedoheptulose 7-phosphate isomerase